MAANERATLQKRISLAVLAVYWIALFVGTHVPRLQPPPPLAQSDKWLHFTAFAVLSALFAWNWSLRAAFGWRERLAAVAILAVYGALDEFTQSYVSRDANIHDWYADLAGILVGLAALVVARRLFRPDA
jgi:VanZ family protein